MGAYIACNWMGRKGNPGPHPNVRDDMSMAIAEPQTLQLKPGTTMPNSRLPVIVYRGALPSGAADFDRLFRTNGWTGIWHNGVFDYDHYHSNAHEVLGVAHGGAKLQLGGPEGKILDVSAGDCLVLPAGTGHRRLNASADFEMIGGYPKGQEKYDIHRERSAKAEAKIAQVALPLSDPVRGESGPLLALWRAVG
jgi:uncharacterized protein YjlB